MVGIGDLMALSRILDPVTTLIVGGVVIWYIKKVVLPRLTDLESDVDDREDRLDDHQLSNQERDLLIDDNAEKIDQLDGAHKRLKKRVRKLEQGWAAEHGRPPSGHMRQGPDDDIDGGDGDGGEDSDEDDGDDIFHAAAGRLRNRLKSIPATSRNAARRVAVRRPRETRGQRERESVVQRHRRENKPPRGDD